MKLTSGILKPYYKKAYNIIYLQIILMLGIAFLWLIFSTAKGSFTSTIFGGISWIIPTFYFTWKIFKDDVSRSLPKIARDFLLAEMIKLFLASLLIILFLKLFTVELLPFLTGFLGAVAAAFFSIGREISYHKL